MALPVQETVGLVPGSASSVAGAPTFAEFYELARRDLLPRLRRSAGDAADDIFADALLAVLERWTDVVAADNPLAWTWTVAKRMAWRRSARDARRPQLEATARRSGADEAAMDADLLAALAAIKPEHAAAFRLTQLEDHGMSSAADQLGVPVATVKVWVHRSRRHLAEQTAGLAGRWVSEQVFSPQALERGIIERGHGTHVDTAMPCLVDRPVRWELHIDRGHYWSGTDDGERMDFGSASLGANRLNLKSIAAFDYFDGVRMPIPLGSNVGSSRHRICIDGDRLRMSLLATEIPSTNGVPDEVFQNTIVDGVVYRWVGRSRR
ncbi:MAG: polymerase sigma-70 factor, subfamily [Ilumatobacteraceae bacterium]